MPGRTGAIRAGAAFVELYANDSKLVRGLKQASRRLQSFGRQVASIGARTFALGAGMTAPFIATAKVFSSVGDELDKMSRRTGISVESLSELSFAAEQSGAGVQIFDRSITRMQQSIRAAERGLSTQSEALKSLGLSYESLKDLSPEEQFKLIADRLDKIQDPTRKAGIALEVFGRAGRQLLPMLEGGRDGIEALQQQARELGLTISSDAAGQAAELTDQMNIVRRVLRRVTFAIGGAVAPILIDLARKTSSVVATAIAWVQSNKQLIVSAFKVGIVIAGVGAAIASVGLAIVGAGIVIGSLATILSTVGSVLGTVMTAFAALLSPIGLVVAGLGTLAGWFIISSGAGDKALSFLGEKFMELKEFALESFRGISDALAAGDIAMAGNILWLSLQAIWQRGVHELEKLWLDFKFSFLDVWNNAINIAANSWISFTAGMKAAMTDFLADFKSKWRSAQGFLSKLILRVMAFFDESIDVDAATNEIESQLGADLGKIESYRQQQQGEIDAQTRDTQQALAEQAARERATRQSAFDDQLAASQAALERAREERQQALDEAAKKRAAQSKPGEGPARPDFSDVGAALEQSKQRVDVIGSFNAVAVAMRGIGESVAERQLDQLEAIAENTGQLATEAQHGGLAFGQ